MGKYDDRSRQARERKREHALQKARRRAENKSCREEQRMWRERREARLQAKLRAPRASAAFRDFGAAVADEPGLMGWGRHQAQVRQVYNLVGARRPRLTDSPYVRLLGPLVAVSGRVDLQHWEPQGRGSEAAIRSLIAYMLGPWTVPAFLVDSLMRPHLARGDAERQARMVRCVARGESIYRTARGPLLPTTLTRRMCHELLATPIGHTLMEAVRRAQVLCNGGGHGLAKAVIGSPLVAMTRNEAFIAHIISWLCRQDGVDPVQLGPVCDYLDYERQRDRSYTLDGRTWRSVMRGMDRWHRALAQEQAALVEDRHARRAARRAAPFRPSGLQGGHWSRQVKENGRVVRGDEWVMREILDSDSLVDEGRELGHCVASYRSRVAGGGTSIWSLVCNRRRRLTIEVDNEEALVVQVRGKANRLARPDEMQLIADWAKKNRLVVQCR